MPPETYSRTMLAAESLSSDDWNVWVDPDNDKVLAHKDGLTLQADIAQHGRDTEELIAEFVNGHMSRTRVERIAWGCLRDGYTAEEIEEAIDQILDS
ncbi:hypothetical protein [Natrarchaeobaculum sulfurireducens]|uniref:Uncharacterized protein n=1 Tax=Natrarchaeobaculum sulfurireducens TaxID=2044521 RepID=A0A346PPS3_9EURY|nr:hypothetical protein [Natrarchaeobaculum sulfurireducens]AXR81518.1 hypothetical protein AArcMg_1505 [Natrarchaeobaculum sulfurireducens]